MIEVEVFGLRDANFGFRVSGSGIAVEGSYFRV